jgi:cytosine/adenosine deaminase-related metal-dependent hydrolase
MDCQREVYRADKKGQPPCHRLHRLDTFGGMKQRAVLHSARVLADTHLGVVRDGAILLQGHMVLAAGSRRTVLQHPATRGAARHEWPDHMLLPGLVNVHCHLDLTHVGPQPDACDLSFDAWAEMIRDRRAASDTAIMESARAGVDLALRGGTCLIGDIAGAGSRTPYDALVESALLGVSFVEFFGISPAGAAQAVERLTAMHDTSPGEARGVRLGFQPHAPYSAAPALYNAAAQTDRPVATHLAETMEERQFVARGDGPLRAMLERLGVWDDRLLDDPGNIGRGRHPIDHLGQILMRSSWIVAHVNDLGDDDAADQHLALLRRANATVAYCPRASDYFGHASRFGPHQYRAMLEAGVNVALGTDSIVCLPSEQSERLSILDEMRHLYRRDGTDPALLLAMATVNGARGLGLDPASVTFRPGPITGMLAMRLSDQSVADPLASMLEHDDGPEVVLVQHPERDGLVPVFSDHDIVGDDAGG